MSTELPDLGSPPDRIEPELRKWLVRAREHIRELRGNSGDPAGAAGSGGGSTTVVIPGAPAPAPAPGPADPPDLTPPPTPSGVSVTAGLAAVYITTDPPLFTQGHGYARTKVYGAKYSGTGPLPTFANASLQHEFIGEIGSFPSDLGVQWHIWVKWLTVDNVESVVPFGGTNGVQVTTGKIGTADLGPLIVEAGNLASGAVTAAKLAAGAVGLTAFAAGLEPVGVVSSLPNPVGYTGPRTVVLTTDGKLYRLVAGAWTATVPAADIAGTLADAQIASLAASKITGQLTNAQIASIAAAKLTGQITSTQITDGAISTPKLAAGAVTAEQIAADTITAAQIAAEAITAAELAAGSVIAAKIAAGAVTATAIAAQAVTAGKIAANAVTANEIAANAITTAKLAAGAVNADQIAAGAIRAQHLLVMPKSLWTDPDIAGGSLVWAGFGRRLPRTEPAVPPGCPTQFAVETTSALTGTRDTYGLKPIPCTDGETFRISFWWNRGTATAAGVFPEVVWWGNTGATITGQLIGPRVDSAGWVRVTGLVTVPAGLGYVGITPGVYLDGNNGYNSTGWFSDVTLEKAYDSSLIVDGSITATKIAANAIAVGSAAIQNGAIVNAMIADATIDSAKIASLAASKITAGSLNVGAFIQSSNYVGGVSGWRIEGGGSAELGAASIRGQLTASQIAAWSISAGRAIIADGTINTVKIEDASITNAKIGDTIQSVGYSPGVSGWLIRKSDGFAEFGAAAIRGKLSAANLVGATIINGNFGNYGLSLSGGQAVVNQSITSGLELTLEAPLTAGEYSVQGSANGYLNVVTNASFAGGGLTYMVELALVFDLQLWNGSSWGTVGQGIYDLQQDIVLTGSQTFRFPFNVTIDGIQTGLVSYTKARILVRVGAGGFKQLAVNGGAAKTDALASITAVYKDSLRQFPN